MLTLIDSADDVIALTISDRIASADLDAIMDRLDGAMARHDKIHVFAEVLSIDGIELPALGTQFARAMPLFGKLGRFGRVAVVADQAWIRAVTRLESAVLPLIDYEVFDPRQREAALAWVEGRQAGPPAPMPG